MKIFVCVKQVPDTRGKVSLKKDGSLDRAKMSTIINPDDLGAVEAALKLKEQTGAKVIAVTMGPPMANVMLHEVYAMGVDETVLMTGREVGGSDTYGTSTVLATMIRSIGLEKDDIIFCGRQAIDGDTAQVGPEISEHLGIPQISYVAGLEYDEATKKFTVTKETEDGCQILEFQGKALLTCLASAVKPRYMSVGGIVDAYGKEVEVWGADRIDVPETELGLKGSPTKVVKSFTKELKAPGQIHEVDAEEAVELIVAKLKEKHII